jgi:hypothetical protein
LLLIFAGVDTSVAGPWTAISSNLDGALTWTGIDRANTVDGLRLGAWAKVNPTSGTHTITVSHQGSYRGRAMALLLTGVNQTTAYGAALSAQDLAAPATSTAATLTITGAAAGKLSLGAMSFDSIVFAERDLVPTGGATEYAEWSGAADAGHLSVIASMGATTLGWTWTGSALRWIAGGLVINAA